MVFIIAVTPLIQLPKTPRLNFKFETPNSSISMSGPRGPDIIMQNGVSMESSAQELYKKGKKNATNHQNSHGLQGKNDFLTYFNRDYLG